MANFILKHLQRMLYLNKTDRKVPFALEDKDEGWRMKDQEFYLMGNFISISIEK